MELVEIYAIKGAHTSTVVSENILKVLTYIIYQLTYFIRTCLRLYQIILVRSHLMLF